MSVFYWTGFVIGVALVFSPALLLVPPVRRRVVDIPLARLITGRWRVRHADPARIARLERELDELDGVPPPWPQPGKTALDDQIVRRIIK